MRRLTFYFQTISVSSQMRCLSGLQAINKELFIIVHKSVQKLVTICSIRVSMNVVAARPVLLVALQPRKPISRRFCNPHTYKTARRIQHIMYISTSLLYLFFFYSWNNGKRPQTCVSSIYISNNGEESIDSNLTQDL